MSRLFASRNRRTRGQALVEFALVIPIFLLLVFAIIDTSRYVYTGNALNEAAREAARQGTVFYRPADCPAALSRVDCVKVLVQHRLTAVTVPTADISVVCYRVPNSGLPPADGVQADTCGSTWYAGDLVRVQISTNFTLLTPFMAQALNPTVQGNASWVTVAS
ncbi:MAG: TadE-like protein [Chloroflexota bacterium]|jgi:Flp pilus assembly protein TadG|nr:TadE-like protein [Chloroflexota bacterium]